MKLFEDFKGGLRVVIGNGSKTRFWKDIWCDEQPLQRVYPLVFSLASDLDAFVHDYFDFGCLIGKFRTLWLSLVGSN